MAIDLTRGGGEGSQQLPASLRDRLTRLEKLGRDELSDKSGPFSSELTQLVQQLFGSAGGDNHDLATIRTESLAEADQDLLRCTGALAADLYDREGLYNDSRACLKHWPEVERQLFNLNPAHPIADTRRTESLVLYALMFSVTEHRDGRAADAQRITERIRDVVDAVLTHLRNTGGGRRLADWLMLRGRIAYAMGRHMQSQGLDKGSEERFTAGLGFFGETLRLTESYPEPPVDLTIRAVTYWTALIVVSLARSFIAQGRLETGYRQVMVARALLANVADQVGPAFADFLLGSLLRQRSDRESQVLSIELLESAVAKFQEVSHERYFYRGRYELAKSYYTNGRFTEASEVLNRELGKNGLFKGDDRTRRRWTGSTLLLRARIGLELSQFEEATANAQAAMDTFGESSGDLRAQAWAVLGDLALRQQQPTLAVERATRGLDLTPVDPNDRAWLRLVLCEAYCQRAHIDNAKRAFQDLEADIRNAPIENEHIGERYRKMSSRLEREKDSFYIPYDETENVPYEVLSAQLRLFLVRKVRRQFPGSTQEEQAKALGIKKQTLANWVTELRRDKLLDE